MRIRHYGLLSTARREQLKELQLAFGVRVLEIKEKKNWKDVCRDHLNFDPDLCPCCGKGRMIIIEMLLPERSPPKFYIPKPQTVNKNDSIL